VEILRLHLRRTVDHPADLSGSVPVSFDGTALASNLIRDRDTALVCANCGAQNDASHKFCNACGNLLKAGCPNCGHDNAPGSKFCSECGTNLQPVETPAQALEASAPDSGQRRFVSVLFADLVGFTSFSENRDAEEVREMLTRYFDRARDIVEQFGGEVDKFIGDAVTAFWGARIAQDDDAERAVRAALELVTAVSEVGEEIGVPDLKLRAGVLTGATSVGSGANRTGLVVGDIVNTASRLQSVAQSGTVVVGESTKELTSGAIRYEGLGEQQLKGKALPVRAWRAVEVIAERGGRGRAEGLEAPFVGREHELRLLKDWLHTTSHEGRARLISIIGEAGIGKSRLAWELQKYVDGLAEVFRWHQGRSPAYGDGVTFWALGEMVRQRAGIAATDEPLRARNKLRACLTEWITDPEERRWIEPRMAGLLGLDEMPAGDRSELFSALRTFFQRMAEKETAVMVFEDLHWADQGLLDFIEELVEMSHAHPILVVTLARPELLEKVPGWGSTRRSFASIHIAPLSNPDMESLVQGLAPGIPFETVRLIVRLAAGVPLYAVEYVRTLIAGGDLVSDGDRFRMVRDVSELSVPDGLQAVISARLDRLDPADRMLIQEAAVLGQSFTLHGLSVLNGMTPLVLEAKLRDLIRKEIFQFDSDPRSPERGQYQFVQSVIKEVAYGRLSKHDRRDRHIQVASYFAEVGAVEFATVIASHYMNAYLLGPDDELADRARASLLDAARRAADLHSHTQVISLCEQALNIPGKGLEHASILELLVVSAGAMFRSDMAIDYGRGLLDHAREVGDDAALITGARLFGRALREAERPSEAISAMAPHYDPDLNSDPQMRSLGAELARAYMLNLENERSAKTALSVMIAAEKAEDIPVLIEAMNTCGTAIGGLAGRVHEGIALLREALRLSELYELTFSTTRALNNLIVMEWVNGAAAVREGYERGLELARRIGRFDLMARMTIGWASVLIEDGRFSEALDLLGQLEVGDEPFWTASKFGEIASLDWITTGDGDALERSVKSFEALASSAEPQMAHWSHDARAESFLRAGRLEMAFEEALVAANGPLNQARCIHVATEAAIRLRDPARLEQARALLAGAVGRRFAVVRKMADAGQAALAGRAEESSRLFEEMCDETEQIEGLLSAARARALFGIVVPNEAGAVEAARKAYQWFSDAGAVGFLRAYSDAWRHLPQAVSA
jgi:class 3 adenylate cyclase